MKEILFRGKCEIEGKWVYGYYTEYCPDKKEWISVIETEGESFYVLPKTVGQYTGIKDKNGQKIFEGDIVKHKAQYYYGDIEMIGVVEDCKGAFTIKWNDFKTYGRNLVSYVEDIEVIGNIFDNTELLGGTENA